MIRSSLGISVPVPVDSDQSIEAIFERLLLRDEYSNVTSEQLYLFEDYMKPRKEGPHSKWDAAGERIPASG